MSAPPKTVLAATPEEEAAIRQAVRAAEGRLVAGPQLVQGLTALLGGHHMLRVADDPLRELGPDVAVLMLTLFLVKVTGAVTG